jgi:hypothetical protein
VQQPAQAACLVLMVMRLAVTVTIRMVMTVTIRIVMTVTVGVLVTGPVLVAVGVPVDAARAGHFIHGSILREEMRFRTSTTTSRAHMRKERNNPGIPASNSSRANPVPGSLRFLREQRATAQASVALASHPGQPAERT